MVAMSGGVDSSLVAVLLREQGYDVTGVTMHLWEGDDDGIYESQCCSLDMVAGARRVCAQYAIPYYVFNYQREFRTNVIRYFIDEYANGATPNPCLACNRDLKFRVLLERARTLGFDYLATGHYARIEQDGTGVYSLWRGCDQQKDQSYVLYMLQQSELARILFPLGGFDKATVRQMARERGLATADRPESQDICFIPDNNYRRFLNEEAPAICTPGPIVNQEGTVLGEHAGLPLYTIGQRKGLGISAAEPMYVTAIDTARNVLVVGPARTTNRTTCTVEQVRLSSGQFPAEPFDCLVQLRAHAQARPATVTPLANEQVQVVFHQPQRAITPGQAAVFYAGEQVLGGGRIMRFAPEAADQPAAPDTQADLVAQSV